MPSVPPAIWNSTSSRSFSSSTAPLLNGVTIATILPLNMFRTSFEVVLKDARANGVRRGRPCGRILQERRYFFAFYQIFDCLAFANHLEPVPLHHYLGHAGAAVVAARHGEAV